MLLLLFQLRIVILIQPAAKLDGAAAAAAVAALRAGTYLDGGHVSYFPQGETRRKSATGTWAHRILFIVPVLMQTTPN